MTIAPPRPTTAETFPLAPFSIVHDDRAYGEDELYARARAAFPGLLPADYQAETWEMGRLGEQDGLYRLGSEAAAALRETAKRSSWPVLTNGAFMITNGLARASADGYITLELLNQQLKIHLSE